MNVDGLQAFFDLGNSTRRGQRSQDPALIGEKGHGTKIFFNSDQVDVVTTDGSSVFHATMQKPFADLYEGKLPHAVVRSRPNTDGLGGTRIEILGYNHNRRDMFSHAQLKDHIQWFTKQGSIEGRFGPAFERETVLRLCGVDASEDEIIPFGHPFPPDSIPVQELFDQHLADAPQYFCKNWVRRGTLTDFPDIKYDMVFAVEGDRLKGDWNPMLRRRGRQPRPGSYQVQERYGLWLTKDYIPIQRKNEWVTSRGSEYTKFHAFLNCQALRLTANRGSIENTPTEIIGALEKVARQLFNEIVETDEGSYGMVRGTG